MSGNPDQCHVWWTLVSERIQGSAPTCTVEPRLNEPDLFNEHLDIKNGILCPCDSKIYEEPQYNEPLNLTNKFNWSPATSLNRGSTVVTSMLLLFSNVQICLLGSYGSLARFREVSRLTAVGDNTVVGGTGDYADFQYLKSLLEQKV